MGALITTLAMLTWTATFDLEIEDAVAQARHVYEVPAPLVRAVIRTESAFNPRAISRAGAIGLMQIMPFNAPRLGFTEAELWDPAKNILAGTRLLAVLLKHYEGDLISVLVAYNAGPRRPGAPIPRNGETPLYVDRVIERYRAELERSARASQPTTKTREARS